MTIKRVTNGWYEWKPNDNCTIGWLSLVQIVQVIEGMVWATGISSEVTVAKAIKLGSFVRRIELSE